MAVQQVTYFKKQMTFTCPQVHDFKIEIFLKNNIAAIKYIAKNESLVLRLSSNCLQNAGNAVSKFPLVCTF